MGNGVQSSSNLKANLVICGVSAVLSVLVTYGVYLLISGG